MGSRDPSYNDASSIPTVHVLVTGFGPFDTNALNPSYLIARRLPPHTFLPHPTNPLKIAIHAHPSPIRVSYKTVRTLVPALLFTPEPSSSPPEPTTSTPSLSLSSLNLSSPSPSSSSPPPDLAPTPTTTLPLPKPDRPNFDIVLFIGMAPGRPYFTLETQAHRDGYGGEDVDGETMDEDVFWKGEGYEGPEVLETGFETGDLWRRWKVACMDDDVRPSTNAGHYLCDFIYYTGLMEYHRRHPLNNANGRKEKEAEVEAEVETEVEGIGKGEEVFRKGKQETGKGERPVMFLHVPGGALEEDVEKGARVAVALIEALVASRAVYGVGGSGDGGGKEGKGEEGEEVEGGRGEGERGG